MIRGHQNTELMQISYMNKEYNPVLFFNVKLFYIVLKSCWNLTLESNEKVFEFDPASQLTLL